jgi:hypothetical protein
MREAKISMILFTVMATLTIAFATTTHHVFNESLRFYGPQPDDLKILGVAFVVFSALVGTSGLFLARTIDWFIWCRSFKKEFGFRAPSDPQDSSSYTSANYGAVEGTLGHIHRFNSREKYVKTALLAEKFGFHVKWPPELQDEWFQAHS